VNPTAASSREHMEAEWQRRAVRLSRRPIAAAPNEDQRKVLVLQLGDEQYGIELADVAEVLPAVRCTPIPGAPPALAGVINIHGEIRPVMDLKLLLGLPHSAGSLPVPVVVLRKRGRQMGLQVDRVEQVRLIDFGRLPSSQDTTRYLKGVTVDTLMLLNAEALFTELLKEEFGT
jgi:purine-binding chemotaxis protein CheW